MLIARVDEALARIVEHVCTALLVVLTGVVLYAVVMRYVFLNPPFWGDITSVLANVAMCLIGLATAIRQRDLIAMQAFYEYVPARLAIGLELLWNLLILLFAGVFTVYGYQATQAITGNYWELGMLDRRIPMMIIPVSGALMVWASLRVVVEDVRRLRAGRIADERG